MGSAAAAAYYAGCELYENYQTHFLDSCYLCNRPLTQNHDIFMYRGNTPFCSQECRQEQMEMDEATEKRLKLSSSKKSKSVMMMMMRQLNSESAAKESSDIMTNNKAAAVRTGGTTVAVA